MLWTVSLYATYEGVYIRVGFSPLPPLSLSQHFLFKKIKFFKKGIYTSMPAYYCKKYMWRFLTHPLWFYFYMKNKFAHHNNQSITSCIKTLEAPSPLSCVAFADDGTTLACGAETGKWQDRPNIHICSERPFILPKQTSKNHTYIPTYLLN